MKLRSLLIYIYRKLKNEKSLTEKAKLDGVNMGKGNDIASPFWDAAEPYLIEIGNNCQITKGVKMYTHGGAHAVRYIYPYFDCFGKVKIGDWVYIGNNALIMPGVTIGSHVIIAAGSIVTKSFPDNVVIAGNPARVVSTIDDFVEKNKKYNLDSKRMSSKDKKNLLLSLAEDRFISK
jgi:carbonic anhydrase/acetyltransferase-like protein (isoleucine patch superfamily)